MTEFEELFSKKQSFIFKYLVGLTRDIPLAEELTQETFFRAYMNFQSLRDKSKVDTWLCQIAKNSYFAYCGEQKRSRPLEDAESAAGGDLEGDYIRKELSERALTLLHGLGEPYKEVFMLYVFGEFSLTEISRVFGKSESWARVTFYRAKQKLAEGMKQDGL